jgi:hypothetical protein
MRKDIQEEIDKLEIYVKMCHPNTSRQLALATYSTMSSEARGTEGISLEGNRAVGKIMGLADNFSERCSCKEK